MGGCGVKERLFRGLRGYIYIYIYTHIQYNETYQKLFEKEGRKEASGNSTLCVSMLLS
jgi:hypothetical protein